MAGAVGSTFSLSGGSTSAAALLTNPYGISIDTRACGTGRVMNAVNFIALTRFGAPFGTAQASVLSAPWRQPTSTGAPLAWIAAIRPFHATPITASLSLSIWAGTAPASHHL